MFDRKRLKLEPLAKREHELVNSDIMPLGKVDYIDEPLRKVAARIIKARNNNSIILMIGGHVIRSGAQEYLIDLLEKGYISCIAMNGGCMIHDFEFALVGATTERVAKYISQGQFGLWKETGQINDIINVACKLDGQGMGEAVGKTILEGGFPYKGISILATCYRLKIPATVHVGIGYDIIHEHPNFDGAATGEASYRDFLKFTKVVEELEGGVVMNFGSAVMAPEVFLKALSMARNVAHQQGQEIKHFATLVCDLHSLPDDFKNEPSKDNPAYFFRPWKTMLVRTVADGGESFYVQGRHSDTIPALWAAINEIENQQVAQINSGNKTRDVSALSEESAE
jgi:hypothetical protein